MNANVTGNLITGVVVVTSVIAAGYLMYALRDNDFIKKARSGFDTGLL